MRRNRTIDACLVPLVLFIFVSSCVLPTISSSGVGRDTKETPSFQSGTVLTQYGNYIYALSSDGGTDTTVSSVAIDSSSFDGIHEDRWFSQISVPEYRDHAAVFTVGNKVYVLGGYDRSGRPRADIFYTYIRQSDGRLGYGVPGEWMRNPRSLPWGLADTAWLVHDGTVFLFGGKSVRGDEDTVLRARMYADGQLGYWYTSKFKLTSPRRGGDAEVWNRLGETMALVAGGASGGRPVDTIDSFILASSGYITSMIPSYGRMPSPTYSPLLLSDGDELLLGSNFHGESPEHRWYRSSDGTEWTPIARYASEIADSSHVRNSQSVIYLSRNSETDGSLVKRDMSLTPAPPVVHPGSGVIAPNTPIRIASEPGTTVHYRVGFYDEDTTSVDRTDPIWNDGGTVTSDLSYVFRAFASDGEASSPVSRRYRVNDRGLFIDAQDLPVPDGNPENGVVIPGGWYRFSPGGGSYEFFIAPMDYDEESFNGVRPLLSLFEPDLQTPVLNTLGNAIVDLETDFDIPVAFDIPQGAFYFNIRSATDGSGESESYRISIVKKEEGAGGM